MKFLAVVLCVAVLCGVSQWTVALEDEAIEQRATPDAEEEESAVVAANEEEELEDDDEDVQESSDDDEVEESEEDLEDDDHPLAKLFGDKGEVFQGITIPYSFHKRLLFYCPR